MIRVETVDNSIEDLIITGMIVDTKFLQQIFRASKPEYFETSISKILVQWIREYYFNNKNQAPGEELVDIFQLNEQELDADESKTVRIFLKKIAKEYEGREFNSDYVLPKALEYLEFQAYTHKLKLIDRELKRGNLLEAKELFNGTSKEIFTQVTSWKSLSDSGLLHSWWGEKKYPAMKFHGALGEYMPNIERGRFYAMLGPAKRGKCASGKSLIHLADGRLVPLKQVVEEKLVDVFCKDDNDKIIPGKAIDWMYSGVKQGYLLTTKSRSTELAKDHKFYTPGGWEKLEDLKPGDLVAVCKNIDPEEGDDILWDSVLSIEKTSMIPMYDLEIEDNHNYLADNFIVHNSFWLMEWAFQGAFDNLNVAYFSLEMKDAEMDARWKERISGKSIMPNKSKEFNIPVLDCVHNQKDKCQMPECTSPGTLVYTDKLRDAYSDHPEHVPCTHCQGIDNTIFRPTHWMIQEKIERLTLKEAKDTQEILDEHIGEDRVRIITFPIGTATVEDIERSLDELALHEDFIADMVVVDYADILKEDIRLGDKRHRVGDNWQKLSRMAKTRNAIVVSASQGNRGSAKKNRLDVDDVAEDFSKVMTIDGIFAINEVNFDQSDKYQIDHNWQVQRIETIALRYGKFVPGLQCITFNDLSRSQIYIGGYVNWR